MKLGLHDSEVVEVVLRKEMTMGDYSKLIQKSRKQGWNVQAYQVGRYSEGLKTKIE